MAHGADPKHSYHPGQGRHCEQLCDESSECHGYSASSFGNCLLWEEPGLAGGGAEWGGAQCFAQQASHRAARGRCPCNADAEPCAWQPAPDCVHQFRYKGRSYAGCTTVDFAGKAWCAHSREYEAGEWSPCLGCPQGCYAWERAPGCVEEFRYKGRTYRNCTTVDYAGKGWCSRRNELSGEEWSGCLLRCPEGCYWREALGCSPRPVRQEGCWRAPPECVPEFWYAGELYEGCTTADADETSAWCSHSFRFSILRRWSNCTLGDGAPTASGPKAEGGFGPIALCCVTVAAALLGAFFGGGLAKRAGSSSARDAASLIPRASAPVE